MAASCRARRRITNVMRIRHRGGATLPRHNAARTCCKQGAFALMEVMIASLILAVLIVSLYGAFSFGFSVLKVNREHTSADQILLSRLETLRMYPWNSLTNGYIPNSFTVVDQGVTYSGSLTLTNAPITETYSNTLRMVTASVTWTSGNQTRSRSMFTFVSQNGIETYKP